MVSTGNENQLDAAVYFDRDVRGLELY